MFAMPAAEIAPAVAWKLALIDPAGTGTAVGTISSGSLVSVIVDPSLGAGAEIVTVQLAV
jgi:hypothetical protein